MRENQVYEDLLRLPEITVTSVETTPEAIAIYCESKFSQAHCPLCLKPCSSINQSYERTLRDLSISGRRVTLHLTTCQFLCPDCDRFFYERFQLAETNAQMTRRYEDFVYKRCIGVELQYVVTQEDLCWKTVARIFDKGVRGDLAQHDLLAGVRALGIDEIALKKGHGNFACVLVNLDTGAVIDLLPDRRKEALIAYFEELGADFCAGIEVLSSDLWAGYIRMGEAMFPNATIVADRFHFFAHVQKAVDNARKQLRRQFKDRAELKRIKWLLLKKRSRLNAEEKAQLDALFAQADYQVLKEAYWAKEQFRQILERPLTRAEAEQELARWQQRAQATGNRFLGRFIKTFQKWKRYILNYFEGRYSNGIVEGINNRIKLIKRRAFGYVNFGHFRQRVLIEFAGLH